MTQDINLSQFVDQKVKVKLRNGQELFDTLVQSTQDSYKLDNCSHSWGVNGFCLLNMSRYMLVDTSEVDIVSIHPVHSMKQPVESLNYESVEKMTKTLLPDVVKFVESREEYAELMFKLFDEFVKTHIGNVNENVKGDMCTIMMDNIYFDYSGNK